jgi:hypothetical protein
VAHSIREYGFRQPIVVDGDGVIVCGHTRWKAAQKLSLAKVPVHVAKDLTPEQVRAYRIADNKTAELAEWDMDLLAVELGALRELDIDLASLGFDEDELAKLFGGDVKDGLTDPDSCPRRPTRRPRDPATSGCSASIAPLRRQLVTDRRRSPARRPADPSRQHRPAVQREGRAALEQRDRRRALVLQRREADAPPVDGRRAAPREVEGDAQAAPREGPAARQRLRDRRGVRRLLDAWFGNMARVLELPGRGFYIWGGYANLGNYPPFLKKHELYFSQGIVWDKQHPVLTRKDFMGAFEIAFYGWREGAAHLYLGPNNATDLWHVKKVNPQSMVHLTEKPVELAVRAMQYSSRPGENVLDLFGGSARRSSRPSRRGVARSSWNSTRSTAT